MSAGPLVHIGYQKTGASWLQQKVFAHPTLGFSQLATALEIEDAFVALNPFLFNAQSVAARFLPRLVEAEAQGGAGVLSLERLSGDSVSGNDAPVIADRLAATFPDGRVLVVIREQPGMMLSLYLEDARWRVTFRDYWKERSARARQAFVPRLERYEFHHLIAHYQRHFGRERVLVLPYEQLKKDPSAFVGAIANVVGAPAPLAVPGYEESMPPARTAAMGVAFRYANACLRTGDIGRVRNWQLRFLQRYSPRPVPFSRRIERRWRRAALELAGDRFAESNRITAELTGLDLSALGYPL